MWMDGIVDMLAPRAQILTRMQSQVNSLNIKIDNVDSKFNRFQSANTILTGHISSLSTRFAKMEEEVTDKITDVIDPLSAKLSKSMKDLEKRMEVEHNMVDSRLEQQTTDVMKIIGKQAQIVTILERDIKKDAEASKVALEDEHDALHNDMDKMQKKLADMIDANQKQAFADVEELSKELKKEHEETKHLLEARRSNGFSCPLHSAATNTALSTAVHQVLLRRIDKATS